MHATIDDFGPQIEPDVAPGLFLRRIDGQEAPILTNLTQRKRAARDRSGTWLRVAMAALAVLSSTAAVVSYQAQYKLIFAYKAVRVIAALQAGIPDVAALVFACLGIALALHGKRAFRARFLNLAAVGTSVFMNVIAAGHGWKATAVWALAPVAYAVTSDTLIGVLRAYTVARQKAEAPADEATPLAVVGGLLFWLLRLSLAPKSTLGGFRRWVVEEAPVAPGRRAVAQAAAVKAIAAPARAESSPVPLQRQPRRRPVARKTSGESKQAALIRLASDEHGLADLPLSAVSRLATSLAEAVGLHPATARRVLVAHARSLQTGGEDA